MTAFGILHLGEDGFAVASPDRRSDNLGALLVPSLDALDEVGVDGGAHRETEGLARFAELHLDGAVLQNHHCCILLFIVPC